MEPEPIKTCTVLENPGYQPIHAPTDVSPQPVLAAMEAVPVPTPPPTVDAVMLFRKKWRDGKILRVHFMDGDPDVHRKVEEVAHTWSRHANVRFKFVDDPAADIRISFTQPGSWSYLGTDALRIARSQSTMNFGWLTPRSPDSEYNRVVIHEFGHALGLVHEHQNPDNGIPWNKPAVYEYYSGPPNNWSKEQVDTNLFQQYSEDQVRFTGFDRESIMLYPIPNEFTVGDFEVGWNRDLSADDKEFIGRMYPKPANELIVDDPPRASEISRYGEIDTYTFLVTQKGSYRIETDGRTDLVMLLYGPEDDTKLIAADDDSGRRLNPRITEELDWGKYTVRLQHFSQRQTGKYAVGVYRDDAAE
nr:metalloprotease [uncultured bacterium]